jgi:hypothetical protein
VLKPIYYQNNIDYNIPKEMRQNTCYLLLRIIMMFKKILAISFICSRWIESKRGLLRWIFCNVFLTGVLLVERSGAASTFRMTHTNKKVVHTSK